MSVTINAKGTSVSAFMIGKNGLQLTQSGEITPPVSSDLVFNLRDTKSAVFTTNIPFSSAVITTTNDQDLVLDPTVGGGANLVLSYSTWPSVDGSASQVLSTDGSGNLYWATSGGGGGSGDSTTSVLTNTSGITINIGQPVYTSGAGTVALAIANSNIAKDCIGLVGVSTIADSSPGNIITSGVLTATATQWDAVTGDSGGLFPGSRYYLSTTEEGKLSVIAPEEDDSGWVAPIGVALSTVQLELAIHSTIKL